MKVGPDGSCGIWFPTWSLTTSINLKNGRCEQKLNGKFIITDKFWQKFEISNLCYDCHFFNYFIEKQKVNFCIKVQIKIAKEAK